MALMVFRLALLAGNLNAYELDVPDSSEIAGAEDQGTGGPLKK